MNISTTMLEFGSNGGTAQGFLARPEGAGPFPAMIVIQEWWGLNDNIKQLAQRFAAEGFVALAPDLYAGRVTSEPDEARKLAMALDMPHAVKDMIGAVNYLCGRSEAARIGVVGFCMGGSLALLLASKTPRVDAAVSFYGGRPLAQDDLDQLGSPILAFYGGRDGSIPPERIEENRTQWQRAGVDHQIVVYDSADHAFFNDTRPDVYDPAAAADAWKRTLAFFRAHLQTA